MTDNPAALYDAIKAALKSVPPGNLSTSAGWRDLYERTEAALAACGVQLTRTQVIRLHWSDDMRTLWDRAEYALERHYGRQGKRVLWPRPGPERHGIRVVAKQKRTARK